MTRYNPSFAIAGVAMSVYEVIANKINFFMKTSSFKRAFNGASNDDKARGIAGNSGTFPVRKKTAEDRRRCFLTEQTGYSPGANGGIMGGFFCDGERGCISCSGLGSG